MGQEFGEYKRKKLEPNKVDWALLGNERNKNLLETYKGLINLRKRNAALHTANLEFFHENPEAGVIAYVRWNDEGSRVAVVANISGHFHAGYSVPNFPVDGKWREWTYSYDVEVTGGTLVTDLPEYEAKVFVWNS
jgi:1,4-alpha-glucan branching enzyme